MSSYQPESFEKKWQLKWAEASIFKASHLSQKPKYYALDMFPYPSGSGLHVGHPLGYIASDIVSRFKRMHGFEVLHPMGYDAFGLPAEQYAIQTGQHPAITTEANIRRFREQLDAMGFSFDWSREVKTCDPSYYKWTQWIFGLFFTHWYDKAEEKAKSIQELINGFEMSGNEGSTAWTSYSIIFNAEQWRKFNSAEKEQILNHYRLAFLDETTVNWCEALGTVLANEEVKDGLSERGGYPVVRKKMKQWSLRITAYADRLLEGLERIDWSDAVKEIQRNWIGKSSGAKIVFGLGAGKPDIEVFSTRPDTIFGATFLVVAPEHEQLNAWIEAGQAAAVNEYVEKAKKRSEIDRMADTKKTGVFTGSYATHPFTGKPIPVWVSDYVLAGYGTGAIMGVPAHDDRDFEFAKAFDLPVLRVIAEQVEEANKPVEEAWSAKEGICVNSEFLNGLTVKEAIDKAVFELELQGSGKRTIQFKLREAGFSRQRYWGEPFPIVYQDGTPKLLEDLPIALPEVESYKPTGTGESPLAGVASWVETPMGKRETNTMPGWAGSSWYFLRYMDPKNDNAFASEEALKYWNQVDLYVGGSEHATGHLLYSRFWTKFLYDLGYISWDEPFKKLVNQGMIQGENGEKMSKSKGNVVNPDDVIAKYSADTLRMYEMFLGPLTDAKPWNTHGIEGVHRFLTRVWKWVLPENGLSLEESSATAEELKVLHKLIKKVTWDIENMSFNTSVSAFMVALKELIDLGCRKRDVVKTYLVLLTPFAPHISEELWSQIGLSGFVHQEQWPSFDERYLIESSFSYPVSINGKHRLNLEFALDASENEIHTAVLAHETVQKWLEGKAPKKIIVVKGRIINVVV